AHSYAFDVSVFEMWGALLHGGHLIVVPTDTTRSPHDFANLITHHGITILSQTPTAFHALSGELRGREQRLRAIVFAGERLNYPGLRAWTDHAGFDSPRLVNMYGITETTVHSTFHLVTTADLERSDNPVGYPLADTAIQLLGPTGDLVPVDVVGEIHVAGPALARGYHDRPALTAERFTPDPWGPPGSRRYRSGDLAHRDTDGGLAFHSRADDQVKIRGHRVEPGEVQAAITAYPGVTGAHVTTSTSGGTAQLVAYVTTADADHAGLVLALREHLRSALPPYMVPAHVVALDELPRTTNGKLDKARLPRPASAAGERVPPATGLERQVAEVWSTVLGVPDIGVTQGFFDLGGDSIRAVALAGALRAAGIGVSVGQILRDRTVRELARGLDGTETAGVTEMAPTEPFALVSDGDRARLPDSAVDAYPLTRNQLGMLVEMLADTAGSSYHNVSTSVVRDDGPFDADALRRAVAEVARRHAALRTSAHLTSYSEPLQVVHAEPAVPFAWADFGAQPEDARRAGIEDFVAAERDRVFAVDVNEPLVRVFAHDLGGEWALTVTHSHAVLDGWSLHLLREELVRLYRALRDGGPIPAERPGAARFADTVAAELAALDDESDREHWNALTAAHQPARLPAHWAGGEGEVGVVVDHRDLLPRLRAVAEEHGVGLKTVLLAAHTKVLSQICPEAALHTGLVTHTRPEAEGADRLVGMHLNTLPHPVDRGARTWTELILATHARESAAWEHRHYPMQRIQQDAGQGRLIDVVFNHLDFSAERSGDVDTVISRAPKEFSLSVTTAEGVLSLRSGPGALTEAHAERLAGMYRAVLAAIAAGGDGDARVVRVPEAEAALLGSWHGPRPGAGVDLPVRVFERQAAATPDAPAVTSGTGTLTYAELDAAANRVAHHLRALGAGPEQLVGVHLERGPHLLPAILGVLKSGAAYLPLDPANPVQRLRQITEDAGARLVLTDADASWNPGVTVRVGDEAGCADTVPDVALSPDNLAYVIYTSGSTGHPKGVSITHSNITRLLHTTHTHFHFTPHDVWSMAHSYAFDV
ncbi:AMP-binding protein, partial [Actinokineospora sp. PR83]|uniref:AMP-binding protein n=1 Tax=Actinokineospora sp. PR83 TaxID=2884908 RepID=UPI001F28C116